MTFVRTVMRNCDFNRRVPLAKTKDVRQRSMWHRVHYRHLRGGILRGLCRSTMDRVAHYARQVRITNVRRWQKLLYKLSQTLSNFSYFP